MGTFKVDVEGFDGALLVAFSEWVKKNGGCYADKVVGEFNVLSEGRVSGEEANTALSTAGYKLIKKGINYNWVRRDDA